MMDAQVRATSSPDKCAGATGDFICAPGRLRDKIGLRRESLSRARS